MNRDAIDLSRRIDAAFAAKEPRPETTILIDMVIQGLDAGTIKVVEKIGGRWETNAWVKKAILLYLRLSSIEKMDEGNFFDSVPLKTWSSTNTRIVPFSSVRRGAYIGPNVVIMAPSFVNIGAYIDDGTTIDSLVTVGACARIGKNVKLGAGTVLGGILDPPNSTPVIIEDNVTIGGNCGIHDGCIIGENAVIEAGTIITARTPIIDIATGEEFTGRVPRNAVVAPGGRPAPNGNFILNVPLIVSRDPAKMASKTSNVEARKDAGGPSPSNR